MISMFYNFAEDSGVLFHKPIGNLACAVPLGAVHSHNLLSDPGDRNIFDVHRQNYYSQVRMFHGLSLGNQYIVIKNPQFPKSFIASGSKIILNSASGDRARNLYRTDQYAQGKPIEEIDNLLRSIALTTVKQEDVPILNSAPPSEFVAESKNFFNFFHYLRETLHTLTPIMATDSLIFASINVVSRSRNVKSFIQKWTNSAFPSLSQRLCFTHANNCSSRGNVSASLSSKHLLYQLRGPHFDIIEQARPSGWKWDGVHAGANPVSVIGSNSYDESLLMFRNHMIDLANQVVKRKFSPLIYIVRSHKGRRVRSMVGEEELTYRLSFDGFQIIDFEELDPFEQVKCVNGAKHIIMQHGAGMTNMLFASPDTHVYEIGTLQTALSRWRDFMPLAHVARCHYHAIFTDMDYPRANGYPVFDRDGLIPSALNSSTIDEIIDVIQSEKKSLDAGDIRGFVNHCEALREKKSYVILRRLIDVSYQFYANEYRYWAQKARLHVRTREKAEASNALYRAWELSGAARFAHEFIEISEPDDPRRENITMLLP